MSVSDVVMVPLLLAAISAFAWVACGFVKDIYTGIKWRKAIPGHPGTALRVATREGYRRANGRN